MYRPNQRTGSGLKKFQTWFVAWFMSPEKDQLSLFLLNPLFCFVFFAGVFQGVIYGRENFTPHPFAFPGAAAIYYSQNRL